MTWELKEASGYETRGPEADSLHQLGVLLVVLGGSHLGSSFLGTRAARQAGLERE